MIINILGEYGILVKENNAKKDSRSVESLDRKTRDADSMNNKTHLNSEALLSVSPSTRNNDNVWLVVRNRRRRSDDDLGGVPID